MSHFLHNTSCPRCQAQGHDKAGDNLGVYSDGHKYCWRCKYTEQGDVVQRLAQTIPYVKENSLEYPPIGKFNEETLSYLKKYKLTDAEIYGNLFGHQDGYVFMSGKFYLIRRLHKKPKVIVKGEVAGYEPIFPCSDGSTTVIVCEDIISAIKISRVSDACALLKTTVHDKLLLKLANKYDKIIIWLDPDMKEHVLAQVLPKVKPYFSKVGVVFSDKDPKEYSTNEIKEYLR